jgi:hypothetical protein
MKIFSKNRKNLLQQTHSIEYAKGSPSGRREIISDGNMGLYQRILEMLLYG